MGIVAQQGRQGKLTSSQADSAARASALSGTVRFLFPLPITVTRPERSRSSMSSTFRVVTSCTRKPVLSIN